LPAATMMAAITPIHVAQVERMLNAEMGES